MLKIIIALFFISTVGYGNDTFLGLGASSRLLKDDLDNYHLKFPVLIYGGHKAIPWAFSLEALYFQEKSSSGTLNISNDQYEMTAYVLRFLDYEEARSINPYLVGGLGVFKSFVTTQFAGTSDKDQSRLNPIAKMGAGAWAHVGQHGFINLEAKGMYSKDFAPELVFDLSARAGLEF
jgi:hypothetical protein